MARCICWTTPAAASIAWVPNDGMMLIAASTLPIIWPFHSRREIFVAKRFSPVSLSPKNGRL